MKDRGDNLSRKWETTVLWQEGFLRLCYSERVLFLSTHVLFSSLFRVGKGVKIAFKDIISSLVSLIAFLCAQANTIFCHCGIKIQPLFARHSCIFLMASLTKLRRDGRAWWVCSFKLFSTPYNQKKMYLQLELGRDYWAHVEQSNQPRVLLSLSALPLVQTLTKVKLLFLHVSGSRCPGSFLCSCSPDIRLPTPPKLTMTAACPSTSACCHPTPVLVGCFRNAWRAESLLPAGEWGYCIFRHFFKTLRWHQRLGDRAAGP